MMSFKKYYCDSLCEALLESSHSSTIQKLVSDSIDDSVEDLAKKLKAWVIQHLPSAQKLNDSVDLLKKIINNPIEVTKQLVAAIISKKIPTLTDVKK